jgi:hypothetical protein
MKKYWAIFKTQLLDRLAYVGDLILQSLTIVLFMWIFMRCGRPLSFNRSGYAERSLTA